jgi:hypothetical protein
MKIAVIAVTMSVVMLTGCVSEKTALTNSQGQQVHCDAWGFGFIGAPVAMASHADCMKKAHAAGYSEMPVTSTPK